MGTASGHATAGRGVSVQVRACAASGSVVCVAAPPAGPGRFSPFGVRLWSVTLWSLLLCGCLLATPAVAASASLRIGQDGLRTRLVLDLDAETSHRIQRLEDPARLLIELDDTTFAGKLPAVPRGDALIRRLALVPPADLPTDTPAGAPAVRQPSLRPQGQSPTPALGLVVELAQSDIGHSSFTLGPGYGAAYRVVVDLTPAARTALTAQLPVQPSSQSDLADARPPLPTPRAAQPSSSQASAALVVPSGSNAVGSGAAARAGSQPTPDSDAQPGSQSLHRPGQTSAAAVEVSPWLADWRPEGYAELAAAYTTADSARWSKLRARVELGASGRLRSGARFKLVGRAQGDAAYSVEDDLYPKAVRDNQRDDFWIREAYLDLDRGDWAWRLGRQHVVWGEMVGLFLADVVSARDTREFFLEEFETMRIPQWAVRAERFAGDAHLELLWVPYMSYDQIGKPGADFYPFALPEGTPVREVTPSRSDLANQGLGARFSYLVNGWDLSAFYYRSTDVAPTLYRVDEALQLRHDRIQQLGGTFSKDFFRWVFKGEAVHTQGRRFLSLDPAAAFGLEPSDALDYVLGIMVPLGEWRFDAQFYGRHVFDRTPTMGFDRNETGLTLLLNRRFGDRGEAELLYLSGLNRDDWSLQPSLSWNVAPAWRLRLGADLFGGEQIGLFGQYRDRDRVFVEIRRWF